MYAIYVYLYVDYRVATINLNVSCIIQHLICTLYKHIYVIIGYIVYSFYKVYKHEVHPKPHKMT